MQSSSGQGNFSFNALIPLLKYVVFFAFIVGGSAIKYFKAKSEERRIRRETELRQQGTYGQAALNRQELAQSNVAPEELTPAQRRERQLAELRRRAAARNPGGAQAQSMVRTASAATPQMPTSGQITIQLPGGGVVNLPRAQSGGSPARPVQQAPRGQGAQQQGRPVQGGRPVRPQNRQQARPAAAVRPTNEQAERERKALQQRQGGASRPPSAYVSDVLEESSSHRLVDDSAVAKVTERAHGYRGLGDKTGLRRAIILLEVLGPPVSAQR